MPDPQQMQSTAQPVTSDSTQTSIPMPDQSAQPQSALTAALQPNVQPTTSDSTQQNIPDPAQQQVQQQQQDAAIAKAKDQRDKQADFHPLVTAAHVARKAALALAGGQQYKETIADDGTRTREPVPMSSTDLLRYSVANILGGLSNMGRAYTASHEHLPQPAAQPLPSQVAQQQRDTQSEQDFDKIQTQKIRQAKVLTANMEAQRAKLALGKEVDEIKQKAIDNHSSDYEQAQKDGNIEADNIPDSQLMKRGYSPSKYIAIPHGLIPAYKDNGERATDSNGVPLSEFVNAIVDGTTQVPLTSDKYQQLLSYGLMRQQKPMSDQTEFTLPEGSTLTRATLNQLTHKIDLATQTQNELDEVHDAVGGQKINLSAKLKENPSLWKAVEQFHNDATSQNPNDQLKSIQRTQPQAYAQMLNLFGQQNLDAYAAKNQTADDLTADKAQSIVSDPKTDKTSPAYQKAVNFLNNARTQKAQTAADEAKAKQGAETNSGDVQEAARNILGGDLTQLKDITSMRGGQRTAMFNAIHDEAVRQNKNPNDFSPAALKTKSDMYEDYRQGKTSNNIAAFDAFLGHANDAMDANDAWRRSGSPLINKPMSWLAKNATNDQNYIAFDTSLEPVRKEFMSFLNANRAEHAEDLKTMETVLNSNNSPAQVETALKQLGKSADIRLAAIGRKYQNTIGTPFPNLVSDEGKQTLSRMGIQSKSAGQASQGQPASPQNGQPNAHPFFSKFGGKADQQ